MKFNCCKYLAELGVPLNEKDIYSQTPIYYAAREGATRIVELFINHGADVNYEDKYGQICLFYAIKNGHEETAEFLLKHNSDINKIDKKKCNLYMFAIKNNRPNIAELLIKYGASTSLPESGKGNKKKPTVKESDEKTVEDSRFNKYVLIKFTEEGKTRLTEDEFKNFSKDHSYFIDIINNPESLELMEKEADERLRNTEGWEKVAKKVLNTLWKMKEAMIFHRPVDPIELKIPDYFTIVKNPMDFGTIKKRLYAGMYTNFPEFDEDIRLVFYNCFLYNGVSII